MIFATTGSVVEQLRGRILVSNDFPGYAILDWMYD